MKGKNAQYNGKIKREDQADGLKAEKNLCVSMDCKLTVN